MSKAQKNALIGGAIITVVIFLVGWVVWRLVKAFNEYVPENITAGPPISCPGGEVHNAGLDYSTGWAQPKYFCVYPYPDAGKPCQKSDECQGDCEISYEDARKLYPSLPEQRPYGIGVREFPGEVTCQGSCPGVCGKYPLDNCSCHFVAESGKVKQTCSLCVD